jgi:hypothetical protein
MLLEKCQKHNQKIYQKRKKLKNQNQKRNDNIII